VYKGPTNQLSLYSISKEPVGNEPIEVNQILFSVKNYFLKLSSHGAPSIAGECVLYIFCCRKVKKKFKILFASNRPVNERAGFYLFLMEESRSNFNFLFNHSMRSICKGYYFDQGFRNGRRITAG
jgi:hypothetical protein